MNGASIAIFIIVGVLCVCGVLYARRHGHCAGCGGCGRSKTSDACGCSDNGGCSCGGQCNCGEKDT